MPILSHPLKTRQPACCSASQAWAWLICIAELAVDGDDDASRALPEAVNHFLAACRGVLR